jgi:hypothetical protein
VIDYHLSTEGGKQYNIVVANESGDAILPENVNVSFYDCVIDNLVAPKRNSIFIGGSGSIVKGQVEMNDGSFIAENTKFLGEVFWRENTRVKMVKDCKFNFRVSAEDNTHVDIVNCGWDGYGSWAIRALRNSVVRVSKGDISKRTKGAWAEKGSSIELIDCTVSTLNGITCEDSSSVNMIGGELLPVLTAVNMKKKSQVTLSNLSAPVVGVEYHVKMRDRCKLVSHGTDYAPTPINSIHADGDCKVEVLDFKYIKSLGGDCITLKNRTTARFISGKDIESLAGVAFSLKNESAATVVDVKSIESKASDAILVRDESKFEATCKSGSKVRGLDSALVVKNDSSASFNRYSELTGITGYAVSMENEANVYFSKTKNITSLMKDAISMTNESGLSLQDHGTVKSLMGTGIVATNDCTVSIQRVKKIEGILGDGIYVANNTNLDIIYTKKIEGKMGWGIYADQNCDIKYTRSTEVKGMIGGVCNFSNGSLDMELISKVKPNSGTGIMTGDQVDTRLVLVRKIEFGVSITDCDSKIKECNNIVNAAGPALTIVGGESDILNIKAKGTGASVMLENTYVKASNTVLDQAIVSSSSTLELRGVKLNGLLTSSADVVTLDRCTISSIVNGNGTSFNIENSACADTISVVGGSLDIDKTATATIMLVESHMKSHLSAAGTVGMTGSSAVIQGGAMGAVTLDATSSVIAMAAACTFAGAGNVISMDSGPLFAGCNGISMIGPIVKIQDISGNTYTMTSGVITSVSPGATNITAGGVITITAPAVAIV